MKDSCLKTKIVIFGCGYIGTRLAELCLEMGWEVTALTRNSTTADLLSAKGVNSVVANLKDKEDINPLAAQLLAKEELIT